MYAEIGQLLVVGSPVMKTTKLILIRSSYSYTKMEFFFQKALHIQSKGELNERMKVKTFPGIIMFLCKL